MDYPKISIITPSYNQASYLEETIRSVIDQRYPNLQYLVIDGGSTDGSVEIIKRYNANIDYWVSQKDNGQVDAINHGLKNAKGDIVAFLNSDDVYLPGALHAVASAFATSPKTEWIAGGVLMFGDPDCYIDKNWWHPASVPNDAADWVYGNYEASQPAHFWKKELFDKFGFFNGSYHFTFDHEFYVRASLGGSKCVPVNRPLAGYRFHDSSKTVQLKSKFDPEFQRVLMENVNILPYISRAKALRRFNNRIRNKEHFAILGECLRLGKENRSREAWRSLIHYSIKNPTRIFSRAHLGCVKKILLKC